jgi:integrase
MVNFNFNLKKTSSKVDTPINLIIRWEKQKLTYSTLEKVNPKHFENDKTKKNYQRIKTSYIGHSEFNERLNYIESTARSIFRQLLNDHRKTPTIQELKKQLDINFRSVPKQNVISFFQFVESFIQESEGNKCNRITGKKIANGTIRIYRNTQRRLKEFEQYSGNPITFDTIDLTFYDNWIDFLSRHLQLCNNSVGRYTKTLKMFLNEATERELNTNLTFRNKRFKVLVEQTTSIYLSECEINELFNLDLNYNKKLERVRDLFIVGCWTGLRFGDLVNILPENIKDGKIEIKTQKTGERVVLPIHPMVSVIMQRYKSYPNSLPPAISNVKMNKYLKEMAKLLESLHEVVPTTITRGGKIITTNKKKFELVTVHTARRSFATNLYKDGVSSLTIMKLTAHKSERVFLQYLKASAEENAMLVQNHWKMKKLDFSQI